VIGLDLLLIADSHPGKDNTERVLRKIKKQMRGIHTAIHGLTEADLLQILHIDEEAVLDDARLMYEKCQSQTADTTDYRLARGVLQSSRYLQWLSKGDSAALFIERFESPPVHSNFSPLTIVSCTTIEQISIDQSAVVIQHFCSLHASEEDDVRGPHGLLRSIIHQVLHHFPKGVNPGFISGRQAREQLQSHDIRALCDCLAGVLRQLPPETVLFCVIDGIDSFDSGEWAESCKYMIRVLLDIVHDDELYPAFKLLVTSPSRTKRVATAFPDSKHMFLFPEGSEGRDNPTERDISIGTRRPKAKESESFRRLRQSLSQAEEDSSDSDPDSWASSSP
jgi:hypothetical protein